MTPYPPKYATACMYVWGQKKMLQSCVVSDVGSIGIFCQTLMQRFAILATILNVKLETFKECVVNQFLQPMTIVTGSMLMK